MDPASLRLIVVPMEDEPPRKGKTRTHSPGDSVPARKATDVDPLCHATRYRVSMSDDAFYRPNQPPAPPRPPKPGEPIWSIQVDHVTWRCEFRFHGESYGWEAMILREGELVIGHRFLPRQLAEAWAGNRAADPRERRGVDRIRARAFVLAGPPIELFLRSYALALRAARSRARAALRAGLTPFPASAHRLADQIDTGLSRRAYALIRIRPAAWPAGWPSSRLENGAVGTTL